jgi:hypothetical protein
MGLIVSSIKVGLGVPSNSTPIYHLIYLEHDF